MNDLQRFFIAAPNGMWQLPAFLRMGSESAKTVGADIIRPYQGLFICNCSDCRMRIPGL